MDNSDAKDYIRSDDFYSKCLDLAVTAFMDAVNDNHTGDKSTAIAVIRGLYDAGWIGSAGMAAMPSEIVEELFGPKSIASGPGRQAMIDPAQIVREISNLLADREIRYLKAWVQETGLKPSECELFHQMMPDMTVRAWVQRRGREGGEG